VGAEAAIQSKTRYNRIAPFYDLMESLLERFAYRRWRERLRSRIGENRVLEVGVGTGKNLPHYPDGVRVTAVDLTDGMLERAPQRVPRASTEVDLSLVDAQRLAFADSVFDTAVATFVFCSVPDPILGLRELSRVKPDG